MSQPALLAHDLVRVLGGRPVLDGVCLTASPGHRIGLIGENGVGKSTLLRVLAGVDEPDAGGVTRPGDLGFLHQEMPFDAGSTIAAVLSEALREAREDLAELDRLGEGLARVPEDDPGHQELLDAVCTDLIDLDPAVDGPVRFGGNYSAYLSEKRAERERWERRYAEEQQELEELRHSAGVTAHQVAPDRGRSDNEKMGYGHRAGRVQSQVSRRVRNATRRLEELERAQVAEPPRPLRFTAGELAARAEEDSRPLVSLGDVRVPGRLTLDGLELSATDRLLVTGGNGAGKSTLLAVLAGDLPARGKVRRRRGLTVGLLTQDTVFDRPERTVRDTYELSLGAARAEKVPLGSLGLMHEADLDKPVGQLSVGQRRRLALALLVARPPQLLLLDEPTNHLSPRLCDELEAALGSGPGAIVVASHDRWLRRRWQGRELRLEPGAGRKEDTTRV
ncbi:ATP-binding cassette domain-containing protein [Streptomyces sp. NPDC059153]|uniref:ATP-binding cassette domain-containing protein n=1 Tax=Streptomyces sp. NPDC059153 TaxID=3346743 RepID=UPI0036AF6AD6